MKKAALSLPILCVQLFVAFSSESAAQPNGTRTLGRAAASGVVTDNTSAPIPGVTVTATPAGRASGASVAVTDSKGAFRLADLKPGVYALEAALEGFQPASRTVTLVTGQELQVGFKIVPAFSETVDVRADAPRRGEVAILESRRQAAIVSDSISAEEIRRTPDSSAAGVVERLTGVTLLGDKYVFVRGLGERYSGTTINGATLPTTETEKRVVPLDLFPARLLETVNVVKTYTPDKPGDFGSGVVEMTTIDFPSTATLRASVGTGYQSGATGSSFRRYARGLDLFGRGGQPLPPAIPRSRLKRQTFLDPSGYTPGEMAVFGQALVGDWSGRTIRSAPRATDYSLTYGDTFGSLGVVLSAVSNHGFTTTNEHLRFFGLDTGDRLVPRNDYELNTNREHADAGLVGNFSARVTEQNRISLNSVLTRDASSESRLQEGQSADSGGPIRDERVRYQIEEVFSNRLRGEHNLQGPGIGSLLEWSVAASRASNHSDLRENIFRPAPTPGVYILQLGFPESGKVDYFNLADKIRQGGVSYTVFYAARSSGSVKAGVDHLRRTRDFASRRFRLATNNAGRFDLTLSPDELFTAPNISPNGFEITETTGINDAYDAAQTVDAMYVMADSTVGKLRLIGGARYEKSDQRVNTFNPFDIANAVRAVNQNRDVLPSLNVVYQYAPQTNLRAAYGRSVNRPEFREVSPFSFVEVTGGRSIAGNPNLKQATIDAFDVRWETFPSPSEVVAASTFYKKLHQPIERIIQPTSELRTSFTNAQSASLWGVELEFRRSLGILWEALRPWAVNFNYAHIKSSVTLGPQQLSVVTSQTRPLEGQSNEVANLALQFLHPRWRSMVRFLGSYSGKRITDVGAYGLPDIYENAFTSVDAVVSQPLDFLARRLEMKIAANNLLNAKRRFTQGTAVQRLYIPGRTLSLSLSYSPF